MTKILITGANSFVGTNFRKYSKFRDVEEISLYEHNPKDIDFKGFDIVLHLAAIVHKSKKIPEKEYMNVNKDLCLRVAENAKKSGVRQFIFLSTCKVYGDSSSDFEIRNEDSECVPDDPYGRSKYEAEIGLRNLEDISFTVSIVRTPLVYGDGVKANMLNIVKLVDTSPLLPLGNIKNMRNFTYIENLVVYIDRIIDIKASGVFIVMDENALSTTELINNISLSLGKKILLIKLPRIIIRIGILIFPGIFDRLFNSYQFDNVKTRKKLNYKSPISTEEGIRRMIFSYKNKV